MDPLKHAINRMAADQITSINNAVPADSLVRVQQFDSWLAKVGNVHRANNSQMQAAYDRLLSAEYGTL